MTDTDLIAAIRNAQQNVRLTYRRWQDSVEASDYRAALLRLKLLTDQAHRTNPKTAAITSGENVERTT